MTPLKVYRLGNPLFIEDLSGEGGRLYAGRWHHKGTPILYAAQSASLSILEYLGHVINTTVNVPYILLALEVDADQMLPLASVSAQLPANWYDEKGIALTRNIGTDWIKSKRSAVLQVPSIHAPDEYNYLINPNFPNLHLQILQKRCYLHDHRFLRTYRKVTQKGKDPFE